MNNNGSCSVQHQGSRLSIWLGLMHHSLNWYVWRIRVSTSLCIFLQTEVIATCIMQHNTETHNTLQNVKWNIQTKDMTKMTLCNYSAILHVRTGECTTKVSSGSYTWKVSWKLSPSPHNGWIAHGSDIAILGMSNHVHPVKCWIL